MVGEKKNTFDTIEQHVYSVKRIIRSSTKYTIYNTDCIIDIFRFGVHQDSNQCKLILSCGLATDHYILYFSYKLYRIFFIV